MMVTSYVVGVDGVNARLGSFSIVLSEVFAFMRILEGSYFLFTLTMLQVEKSESLYVLKCHLV